MNPLYIALPLFIVIVWAIAVLAIKHDRKVRDQQGHKHIH